MLYQFFLFGHNGLESVASFTMLQEAKAHWDSLVESDWAKTCEWDSGVTVEGKLLVACVLR